MKTSNAACNYISERAWELKTFNQFRLHHLVYYDVRQQFGLSAQIAVLCIAKVANAYKLDKSIKHVFKPTGAISYDNRVLSWRPSDSTISIWTVDGRKRIPFVCGERQKELLKTRQGESDLVFIRGMFFLFATCNVEEAEPIDVKGVLGVDLGVVNIAVDSDGQVHSASQVNNMRYRHRRLRSKLQSKGTKAAKRRLKKLSGKENRFAKDVNHCISKQIVIKAKDTERAIALEDLKGISDRITVRRQQRVILKSWSFAQLRTFIEYKAAIKGVLIIPVNPRNTSRTCPCCGCIDKRNRPNQSTFLCVSCGFSGLADHIAAGVIASRAAINLSYVSDSVV